MFSCICVCESNGRRFLAMTPVASGVLNLLLSTSLLCSLLNTTMTATLWLSLDALNKWKVHVCSWKYQAEVCERVQI